MAVSERLRRSRGYLGGGGVGGKKSAVVGVEAHRRVSVYVGIVCLMWS